MEPQGGRTGGGAVACSSSESSAGTMRLLEAVTAISPCLLELHWASFCLAATFAASGEICFFFLSSLLPLRRRQMHLATQATMSMPPKRPTIMGPMEAVCVPVEMPSVSPAWLPP